MGEGRQSGRARAVAAAIGAARRRAALAMPDPVAALLLRWRRSLAEWVTLELAPGRLAPWLPVTFGLGIAVYFTADREPAVWAAVALSVAALAAVFALRRHPFGFPVALGLAAAAVGFAVAAAHTAHIAHPVLRRATWSATVSGFVEARQERARSDRIVVRVTTMDAGHGNPRLERVRVAVRKNTAPAVGAFVSFKARLSPPLQPLRPGGYDFARDLYFQEIGASGYVLGKLRIEPPPQAAGFALHAAAVVEGIREGIDDRIRTILAGDRGSIASALITGKRDAITEPVNDAMYVSSLAHVLSISGYHMAVVAGIVFFVIRAGFALFPALAVRRPIKKWAATGALIAAALYLILSGAEVATQRSFIMVAIVLAGVMLDRPALTFRTLAIAAFVVLAIAPQSLVHPSFQMSFAAALALVAVYQNGLPWRPDADSSLAARAALWGWREIAGLILASLVAGLATTSYAAFHFHRLAPYGVIANLLAMPVVSAWVMPMGILGVVTMPFGFDAVFWQAMGAGLDWMIAVALWVAHLPGAVGRIHAFGVGPLLLATAGLLVVCLLRSPLRWCGAVPAAIACVWVLLTPRPDVLIAADRQTAAVRSGDGKLRVLHASRDSFALKDWLAADADPRDEKDASLRAGILCDAIGCIGRLDDGRPVSFALDIEAFAEDCARAAVVVSPRAAQRACAAVLVDRNAGQDKGAIALYRTDQGFALTAARPTGHDRPWARAMRAHTQTPAVPSEATPASDSLDADD